MMKHAIVFGLILGNFITLSTQFQRNEKHQTSKYIKSPRDIQKFSKRKLSRNKKILTTDWLSICTDPVTYNPFGNVQMECYKDFTSSQEAFNECPLSQGFSVDATESTTNSNGIETSSTIYTCSKVEYPQNIDKFVCPPNFQQRNSQCKDIINCVDSNCHRSFHFYAGRSVEDFCEEFEDEIVNLNNCCVDSVSICDQYLPKPHDSGLCVNSEAFLGSTAANSYCFKYRDSAPFSDEECPSYKDYETEMDEGLFYCFKEMKSDELETCADDLGFSNIIQAGHDNCAEYGFQYNLIGSEYMNKLEFCTSNEHVNLNQCCPGSTSICDDYASKCSAGKVELENGDCYVCGSGTKPSADRTKCIPCEAGTYSPGFLEECLPCESGSSAFVGSASCNICPAGTYAPPKAIRCFPCEKGTASHPGSASCYSCNGQDSESYYDSYYGNQETQDSFFRKKI